MNARTLLKTPVPLHWAVCIWCITSAILMTLLLLLSINPVLSYRIGGLHAKEKTI